MKPKQVFTEKELLSILKRFQLLDADSILEIGSWLVAEAIKKAKNET